MQQSPTSNPAYRFVLQDVEGFDSLAELALDLRWAWNHAADDFWRGLDAQLWELTRNPWAILHSISPQTLKAALGNPAFRRQLNGLVQERRRMLDAPTWFSKNHANSGLATVAYFSMEFMLSEALPIYSGGLGNVAGDQLKAASDLGVPVVGVGLLYQQGYFRQLIDSQGYQQALYPYNDPGHLPITPLRDSNGMWLRLEVKLPGRTLWLRSWQAQVGRCVLYLLDSNDPANYPPDRGITSELYGGDAELRLRQEMILGIAGWRLLAALGIHPQVCHLNEGHAAFATLERARSFSQGSGQRFEVALAATRAGNLFTTHTAVPAGFDRFPPQLMEKYLAVYAQELGISMHDFLALGRANPSDGGEPFNMAYLAIRGSGAVNGVSRLHGEVSRELFQSLFPRWPRQEVPAGYVTNGVHMPTWDSAPADELWTRTCGDGAWEGTNTTLEQSIKNASDTQLWELRNRARKQLVEFARQRLAQQLATRGASPQQIEQARQLLNPDALTLGFARRFATYKRPNLLLHDAGRLLRLLNDPQRPVQLIIAGKAHPADWPGQEMIRQWIRFLDNPAARAHIIFLSDYDMLLAEQLVQGADAWINTPRRPWEASGTSGMKVLVNGGLNLSELDGWWAEAYTSDVGWALGDGREHGEDPAWDAAEAERLYELLENEVVPTFYERGSQTIPAGWITKVRASMATLAPRFSAERTVRQYTENYYLPAATAQRDRTANNGALAVQLVDWSHALQQHWPAVRFGNVKITTSDNQHHFEVEIHLQDLDPNSMRVELYADAVGQFPLTRQELARSNQPNSPGSVIFTCAVPATRPAGDFTLRAIPNRAGVSIPLEASEILWQR